MNLSQLLSLFYIKMNYTFDLWDLEGSDNSVGHFDYFYDAFSPNQHFYTEEYNQASKEINPPMIMVPHCISLQASQNDKHEPTSQSEPKQFKHPLRVRKSPCNSSQKLRKKRQAKSSPYHNYQKHLNNTLKQLLTLEILSFQSSQEIMIAHNLWNIFLRNESSTKKILNFVFNEYNEYPFIESDLEEFGFKQMYSTTPSKLLADARVYLTKVAIDHLNEENIDRYLQTRRIRNPLKFKKYLMVFRKQLQEGFLKKRFTNRSRKEQLRKIREKQIEISQ